MPYCPSCGQPLTGEGRFCAACGAPQAVAPPPPPPHPPQHPASHPPSVLPGQAPPPVSPQRRPFPGWAVAFFVILAISVASLLAVFVMPLLILGSIFSAVEKALPGIDRAAQVRSGVRTIQTGIETWRADNARGAYPPEAVVTPARLGRYVDPWPVNPYTGGPMQPGAGPGDYHYVRLPGGEGYRLTGYGGDGAPLLTAP
ncbi:MAG: hypothetical protein WCP98_12250 [Actinomycetes bacterium]